MVQLGCGLEAALTLHVWRAEARVLDRLVDITLLVLTVFVILNHLQRVIILWIVRYTRNFLRLFLALCNRLQGNLLDFFNDDKV